MSTTQFKPETVAIPTSLGGGRMPIHRTYDRKLADSCTAPWCNAEAVTTCGFALATSAPRTCGAKLCADHARELPSGEDCCPTHARMGKKP